MAYFRKLKSGSIRAEVERLGLRTSDTFPTMAAARAWAAAEETKILSGAASRFPAKTLTDAIDRYVREVSVNKRSSKAETLRLLSVVRDFPSMCGKLMTDINQADIASWRDTRLKSVSPSTVVREATPFRNLFAVAEREWMWIGKNPWEGVRMPSEPPARTRRTSPTEMRRMLRSMGYVTGKRPSMPRNEVAYAWLIAHHTAMRAGEVLSLSRSSVNLTTRVAKLESHKTLERDGVRFVPFTAKAARVMAVLDAAAKADGRDDYFTISSKSLDALFRKVKDQLLVKDLHFHDSRADALTRLAKRVDVMKLAKISGHRDLNQLLGAYYRATPEEIAASI